MVVSGAPDKTKYHAVHIADLAFGMLETMKELVNPASSEHLKIRIGKHPCFIWTVGHLEHNG